VRELRTKYQVSRILGKTWIQERELLLLLDGLDEVREDLRGACIQAINHFRQEFGGTEIVVCSRLEDYKNLQDRLQFHAAIILQPLTYEQVAAYLNRTGAKLAGVKMAWETDSVMQELAQTPLMLSVMALAYEGISAQELPQMNLEERRTHLWDKYINRMFERRRGERIYPKESAIAWLSFLAQRMAQESQTLFAIEAIQPSWLQYRRQRWLYSLSVGFAAIVIAELGFGFTIGLAAGAIAPEMTTTLLSVLIVSLVAGVGQSIKPFEPLGWSWSWQRAWKPACTIFAGGFTLSLLVVVLGEWFKWTMAGFSTIITFGSGTSLMTALAGGFLSGFVSAGIDCKLSPNQGMWRSAINSAYFALVGFAFISILLIALPPDALEPRPPFAAPLTLVCLYGGGLACLQHILLRSILWLRGDAPWNYAKFLKYTETLLVIQHVGGQYKFVHNLLQNYLETHSPREIRKPSYPKIFVKFCILSIITLGLCIGVLPFTIDTWRVNSLAAEVLSPRLEQNDRLMVKKNISGFNPLHRRDIIGFQPTDEMIKQAGQSHLN
jgi:hypothetical protein